MKKFLTKSVQLLFIATLLVLAACEPDAVSDDTDDTGDGNSTTVNPYGNWVRGDGVLAYLKFGTGTVTSCSNGKITTGTFNASEPSMTYTVQGDVIKFPLRFNTNNTLLVGVPDQAVNTNNATLYYRSDQFPCTGGGGGSGGGGGGGGGATTGKVLFWTSSDLGCGIINVSVSGQSKGIAGFYASGTPDCGASYGANFTLPLGTFNFTASCSKYTWNGTVTITPDGCAKMRLY